MIIETLNQQFGIPGKVQFSYGKGGLHTIVVSNQHASAEICIYGAQLLSYIPTGQQDVLWMSERSLFEEDKAIRGGIPLCFPWFGPHASDKTKPQHGFARLQYWQVKAITETTDESIAVTLALQDSAASLPLWPHAFNAEVSFVIGKTLEVKLTVTNTGNEAFEYSDALHTYFNIGSIGNIAVEGLQHASYYEAFDTTLKTQEDTLLHFTGETNRRYVNTSASCCIHDKTYNRKIQVGKTGSKVTVVWNPGEATAKTIADMVPDGYKHFVCVEPANAYAGIDMIHLKPGENYILSTLIGIAE